MSKRKLKNWLNRERERTAELKKSFESLPPEKKLDYIPSDGLPTEFEIQSFLYEQLKGLGYHVRGEVRTICGSCIFDLVVFRDGAPVRIIEVKKRHRGNGGPRLIREQVMKKRESQVEKYKSFGVHVDLVCTMPDAVKYIEAVKSWQK